MGKKSGRERGTVSSARRVGGRPARVGTRSRRRGVPFDFSAASFGARSAPRRLVLAFPLSPVASYGVVFPFSARVIPRPRASSHDATRLGNRADLHARDVARTERGRESSSSELNRNRMDGRVDPRRSSGCRSRGDSEARGGRENADGFERNGDADGKNGRERARRKSRGRRENRSGGERGEKEKAESEGRIPERPSRSGYANWGPFVPHVSAYKLVYAMHSCTAARTATSRRCTARACAPATITERPSTWNRERHGGPRVSASRNLRSGFHRSEERGDLRATNERNRARCNVRGRKHSFAYDCRRKFQNSPGI